MGKDILMKAIFAGVLSLICVWGIFERYEEESGSMQENQTRQKYLPFIPGNLLPVCILVISIFGLVAFEVEKTIQLMISVCFGVFLHIGFYYIVLMMMIPLLRKFVSARTCAMLWMIPNYLYIVFYDFMKVGKPVIILHASRKVVWLIGIIWIVGFLIVFLGNMISHHIFRTKILKHAKVITDTKILELWNQELDDAKMKYRKYALKVSENVKTPLTIGVFRRKICVVLPDKVYSEEELKLIFKHEIVHIGREDAWSKFFLLFCTAMCWFNPLMWVAMRKSADDLELSCDETVLLGADDETRIRYANLILSTAGDERGFTTCLSASALSISYRLKNIMKEKKTHSGAWIIGIAFFVLSMSYGYAALAYGETTGKEAVYDSKEAEFYEIEGMYFTCEDRKYNTRYECADMKAFHQYMYGLKLEKITGKYSFSENTKKLNLVYKAPAETEYKYVSLSENLLEVLDLHGKKSEKEIYYISEQVNWEALEKIVVGYPALNVQIKGSTEYDVKNLTTTLQSVKKLEDGKWSALYENEIPKEAADGFYGAYSVLYKTAILDFSHELVSGYTVEIESWDGTSKKTISEDNIKNRFEIPIVEYPAHYHVYAQFYGEQDEIYDVEFLFNMGYVGTE